MILRSSEIVMQWRICKPGSVEWIAPLGRSFLSEYDHSYALAAYPRRLGREGPSLAAYLALLQLGFTMPQLLPDCAVSSYLTVSPLPEVQTIWRFVFCGTFRHSPSQDWCPGVTWQSALWSPDFPR